MKNSDNEAFCWLEAMAQKDRKAFEKFYDRFVPLAFGLALRILRSRHEAEDLIQEVFLQIWNQADQYDARRGNPEAWISTITKSRAIDKLRSHRRKEEKIPVLEEKAMREAHQFETQTLQQASIKWEMEGALAGLSEIQRTALEKAYFEGKTQTEIAAELSVPVGTVKTRIRDGLLKLRQQMTEQGKMLS